MKTWFQSVLVIVAFAVTIGAALIYGQKSYRWGTNQQVVPLIALVQEFPTDVGDWTQVDQREIGSNAQRLLNCFASFVRVYQNNQTGERINVALLLGPTGPISVHTPEVCFNAVNYQVHKKRTRIKVGTNDFADSYWSVYFQSKEVDGGFVRSVYGWSDDGDWKSPDTARFAFAGKPYLFKLQFGLEAYSKTAIETDDSIERFLETFIPVFRRQKSAAKR